MHDAAGPAQPDHRRAGPPRRQRRGPRLKSGVTVLVADAPFVAGVDVRGGAPGTRETDLLAPGRLVGGGGRAGARRAARPSGSTRPRASWTGCARWAAASRSGRRRPRCRSCRRRSSSTSPTAATRPGGRTPTARSAPPAFDAAAEGFALGTAGAGTGAMTATLMGGLGSASLVTESGATVGALVAVNAFGERRACRARRAFWAGAFEIGEEFGGARRRRRRGWRRSRRGR